MFLKKSKSNNKVYLSFVESYRQNGKPMQKTIQKIGYLEDLEKEYDDPIAHFREIARQKTEENKIPESIMLSLSDKLPDNSDSRKNLGYAIPKYFYGKLGLREFFQNKQKNTEAGFNLNQIFSDLVFARFINPCSKKRTHEKKDTFFERSDYSLDDLYRSLDYFSGYSDQIQREINDSVKTLVGRDSSLSYYDVTNYYFEIPYEDEDITDDNGNFVRKGTRKKGPSKEHRKTPIIQMGLLMDSNSIPIAFNLFSGGDSEKTSLLPTIRRVKKDYGIEKTIVVADRGLNTSDNTAFLSGKNHDDMNNNDGYVYGQSVMGADRDFKEWVLDRSGYVKSREENKDGEMITFTHKSRVYAKKVTLKDSKGKRKLTETIYQKQMAYYSEKYAKKQKHDREKVIKKALDLIDNPTKYNRATSVGAAGYIDNLSFVKSTGEISDGKVLSLNIDKIREEEKYDGYYSIVTSEKDLSDKEIRDIYRGLWRIEESFKILKSEFDARPVFVRTDAHIDAHFLVCFVALVIMRLMEYRTENRYSAKRIRNSLVNYSCSHIDQNYYLFDYRDEILVDFEKITDLDFSSKILSLQKIKNILKWTK